MSTDPHPVSPQSRHVGVTPSSWQGMPALRLGTANESALVTLFGAQVISWVPADGVERLWQSATPRGDLPAGLPVRGGIPLCWPWFARQNRAQTDPQHGVLRNALWNVATAAANPDASVTVTLSPAPWTAAQRQVLGPYADLQVQLVIQLGTTLTLHLITHHVGPAPLILTQAFHSYFAVDDVLQTHVSGLAGTTYLDKRAGFARRDQADEPTLHEPVDRIYEHTGGQYALRAATSALGVAIESPGSTTAVLWNPGEMDARGFADVPGDSWRRFVCLEVAHASAGSVQLQPGQRAELVQRLRPLA